MNLWRLMCWLVSSELSLSLTGTLGSVTKGQRKGDPVSMESLAQLDFPLSPRNSLTKPHLHKCEDKTFKS